jgi:hypothetical protein
VIVCIRRGLSGIVDRGIETNLGETDVCGLLAEALTADVHLESILATNVHITPQIVFCNFFKSFGFPYAVLADQTGAVGADTAEGAHILAIRPICIDLEFRP